MPPKKKQQPAKKAAPKKQKEGAGRGKDRLNPKEIEREYGFAYKFFKSSPELWKLLNQSINQGWGVSRFQAELRSTKWFKKHSDIWRQNTALRYSDPTTYQERLGNYRTQVANLAGQWGADLTKAELTRISTRAFMFGWSEAEIMDHLAPQVEPSSGRFKGQLAGMQDQLQATAHANGINLNESSVKTWMRSIVSGSADIKQYQDYIRSLAAQTFKPYARDIQAGVDVADLAAPYMQSMAETLEINPASINMFDPTIRKAMAHQNEKGEAVPLSVTDFEDQLRADNRWQYTDSAHKQLKGYANQLGKLWGIQS